MDDGRAKILLCDLAKDRIGDDNPAVGFAHRAEEKLAALSRQDYPNRSACPLLVCEEAQNFIGDFESILAEHVSTV